MHFFHHSVFSKYMKNTEWYKTVHLKETWKERKGMQSSVQSLSCLWLFATPWTAARQASLSITNSWSPPKPMSIEFVMPSNYLILCCPLLLLPSIFPSIRVFSFFFVYFILFFNFMILYWFCHISTCIHHRYTRVPHPEPSSLPTPHTNPLGLFKWVSSLHQVAKVLEFQLQHQSFQWTPRTDLL